MRSLTEFWLQVARRSLPGPASPLRSLSPSAPATGLLVDILDPVIHLSSPVTKTYSKTGASPAAKQRESDAFDLVMVGNPAPLSSTFSSAVQEQELISFDSPTPESSINLQSGKEDPTPNQRKRRSSRMKTPRK